MTTTCDGCGEPLHRGTDMIFQETVTLPNPGPHLDYKVQREFCSPSCMEDYHEQMSRGRTSRALQREVREVGGTGVSGLARRLTWEG